MMGGGGTGPALPPIGASALRALFRESTIRPYTLRGVDSRLVHVSSRRKSAWDDSYVLESVTTLARDGALPFIISTSNDTDSATDYGRVAQWIGVDAATRKRVHLVSQVHLGDAQLESQTFQMGDAIVSEASYFDHRLSVVDRLTSSHARYSLERIEDVEPLLQML